MHNWAAIVIAFGVFVVGYAQWRTANQRVVLDLFQRRLDAYNELESAVASVLREGSVDEPSFRRYLKGKMDARFLFGTDVLNYLDNTYKDIVALQTIYRNDVIDESPNRATHIERKYETFARVAEFTTKAPEIFAPYIKMAQKNTPFWRPW